MWSACLRSKGCLSSAWHEHAYGMSMSVRTESFLLRTLAHVYTPPSREKPCSIVPGHLSLLRAMSCPEQTPCSGVFQGLFQRRFRAAVWQETAGGAAFTPGRHVIRLPACLPALPSCLAFLPGAGNPPASRPATRNALPGRTGTRPISQNRLHSGYILAGQGNRLISQNRLDGGWVDLPG